MIFEVSFLDIVKGGQTTRPSATAILTQYLTLQEFNSLAPGKFE